jgi:hypothetical protein
MEINSAKETFKIKFPVFKSATKIEIYPVGEANVHVRTRSDFIQVNRSDAARLLVGKVSLFIASHLKRSRNYSILDNLTKFA